MGVGVYGWSAEAKHRDDMLIILSEKKIERPQPVFPLFKKCP
jgi:hypothetical protein